MSVNADSRLWGVEGNLRCHVGNERLRGEVFVGGRYLRLEENLVINDTLLPIRLDTFTFQGAANFVNPPDFVQDQDQFRTKNMFYGGQVGGVLIWEDWWYFLRLSGKVGFGLTEQRVQIAGTSTLVTPAGRTTVEGGILALPTNIGSYSRSVFGIVPEWGITGGVYVTDWMRVSVGYSILLWNRVVRPGDAIDPAG
ncbi:MAG: BBP7 family outer membrane beta-barrel protein [Gemmataceae bacterium]